jgi:hypothetical protein
MISGEENQCILLNRVVLLFLFIMVVVTRTDRKSTVHDICLCFCFCFSFYHPVRPCGSGSFGNGPYLFSTLQIWKYQGTVRKYVGP